MNILIVAGGTGSIQIQRGLFAYLDGLEGVKTQVLVNAYDNGLSTGAVRTVVNGQILGPSDVRKNQTTLLKLVDPKSPFHALLDIRFTIATAEAREFCLAKIAELPTGGVVTEFNRTLLKEAVEVYFHQKLAMAIDYNDFALANIIYAGFAIANGNSLRQSAAIMAGIMGLPRDCVILNDDRSMFLGAVTQNGVRLHDEGDIVKWGNLEDPIVDVFFTDNLGHETQPVLCDEATRAIVEADLIILSTGTQWSSLIPTYASVGFKDAINRSGADIVMLMNRIPDKDSPGQTADQIIRAITPRYFPEKRIKLIADRTGEAIMRTVSEETSQNLLKEFALYDLSDHYNGTKVHAPGPTIRAIMIEHFGDLLKSDVFMFDYDDTLVARGNNHAGDSSHALNNLMLLNKFKDRRVYICTGNSIKAVNIIDTKGSSRMMDALTFSPGESIPLDVFADGGVNLYAYNVSDSEAGDEGKVRHSFIECIAPELTFPETGDQAAAAIIARLQNAGIPRVKIENRGDVMISIRPIDPEYRPIIADYVRHHLVMGYESEHGIIVRSTGRSTIDICNKKLSKSYALHKILSDSNEVTVTYVGDELYNGNDEPIRHIASIEPRVQFLNVKSIAHTAVFLRAVISTQTR